MFVLFILGSKKVKTNVKSLNEAKSARDCFRILDSENLFSHSDVIFMQFLLRKTECKGLEIKCIEYANRHNALGFYEKQTGKVIHFFPLRCKSLHQNAFPSRSFLMFHKSYLELHLLAQHITFNI